MLMFNGILYDVLTIDSLLSVAQARLLPVLLFSQKPSNSYPNQDICKHVYAQPAAVHFFNQVMIGENERPSKDLTRGQYPFFTRHCPLTDRFFEAL